MISVARPLLTRQPRHALRECVPVSPLFAAPTNHWQTAENKTTLSSVFATLTSPVKHKFFVCHSYKKHPGWGYISCPLSPTASPTIPFRMRTSAKRSRNPFRIRTSKTQDLKPFRIRTYEKTPRGAPLSLSLPPFAPSAIIIGLALPPGSTTFWPVRNFRSHDAA